MTPIDNTGNYETPSVGQFKSAKDSLIASLFELSKAANEVSKNAIDFFNLTQAQQHAGEAAGAAAAAANGGSVPKKEPKARKTPVKRQRAAKHALPEPQADKEHAKLAETESDGLLVPVLDVVVDGDVDDSEEPLLAAALSSTPVTTAEDTPVVEEKKTRKKRAAKDPNAPKKPLTSYILFYNHLRSSVAEKNTELSQVDIAKEIARQWKEMSESDKNYWKGIYEKDKVKYDQELAKYNASKVPLPKDVLPPPQESPKGSPKAEKRSIIDIEDPEEPIQLTETTPAAADTPEPPKKKKSKKNKKSKKAVVEAV